MSANNSAAGTPAALPPVARRSPGDLAQEIARRLRPTLRYVDKNFERLIDGVWVRGVTDGGEIDAELIRIAHELRLEYASGTPRERNRASREILRLGSGACASSVLIRVRRLLAGTP